MLRKKRCTTRHSMSAKMMKTIGSGSSPRLFEKPSLVAQSSTPKMRAPICVVIVPTSPRFRVYSPISSLDGMHEVERSSFFRHTRNMDCKQESSKEHDTSELTT